MTTKTTLLAMAAVLALPTFTGCSPVTGSDPAPVVSAPASSVAPDPSPAGPARGAAGMRASDLADADAFTFHGLSMPEDLTALAEEFTQTSESGRVSAAAWAARLPGRTPGRRATADMVGDIVGANEHVQWAERTATRLVGESTSVDGVVLYTVDVVAEARQLLVRTVVTAPS